MLRKRDEAVLSPFRSLFDLNREMGRVFDRLVDGDYAGSPAAFRPDIDIVEEDDRILVSADLPGMKDDDIEVSLSDGVLTIKGVREEVKSEKQKSVHRRERYYGSFVRKFTLPANVESDNVKAVFRDGVLEISLPLAEAAKERRIAIEAE
ncbi:Hsp20/alpha crystallin family protein [Limisalsivibrio acetivorans]|uniref:Hsp20/alpha crystallin family protein n=1 Tax=Limisalsivibrio acetivorans TaxID=1304888 RepID=UPI0003B6191E|nr:Hsp20/alpha crystallin family protein [Limisalsivibrio acetivorans]